MSLQSVVVVVCFFFFNETHYEVSDTVVQRREKDPDTSALLRVERKVRGVNVEPWAHPSFFPGKHSFCIPCSVLRILEPGWVGGLPVNPFFPFWGCSGRKEGRKEMGGLRKSFSPAFFP